MMIMPWLPAIRGIEKNTMRTPNPGDQFALPQLAGRVAQTSLVDVCEGANCRFFVPIQSGLRMTLPAARSQTSRTSTLVPDL
jgi:hypothetical protein